MNLPADLPLIGTATHFLRPSSLDKLVKCQVWYTMMLGEDDAGGAAAQTGSLVHAAVAAFHQEPDEKIRVQAAIEALGLNSPSFPLADQSEARLYLTPYIADPRNSRANVVAVEHPVALTLEPHPLDPTKQPIHIRGTLDQIRHGDGKQVVCDLKTGRTEGWAMIHDYAYQQAAYTLAARESGFPNCQPGYIIRNYGYRAKTAKAPSPDGVNWWMPFTIDGAWALMDRVRLAVATLRAGYVEYGPGPQCSYCPLGGLSSCQEQANAKLFSLPMASPATKQSISVPSFDAKNVVPMFDAKSVNAQFKAAEAAKPKQVETEFAKLPAALRAFAFPAKVVSTDGAIA